MKKILPLQVCILFGCVCCAVNTVSAKHDESTAHKRHFVDENNTRYWPTCIFQSLSGDVADQIAFALLGGRIHFLGSTMCNIWEARPHSCACSAPHAMLGSHHTVVEIGANDGLHMSNSWFFESFLGWRSILVEANPDTFLRLAKNRPHAILINALIGEPTYMGGSVLPFISISRPAGQEKTGHKDWESGLSGIEGSGHKEIASLQAAQKFARPRGLVATRSLLPVRSFESVFSAANVSTIDFLSIDVEGAESGVLNSINFRAVKVRMIIVEAGILRSRNELRAKELKNRLTQQWGFRKLPITTDMSDDIYVSQELGVGSNARMFRPT